MFALVNWWAALSRLQLVRARVMTQDKAKADAAWKDVLTLCKNAGSALPIF